MSVEEMKKEIGKLFDALPEKQQLEILAHCEEIASNRK